MTEANGVASVEPLFFRDIVHSGDTVYSRDTVHSEGDLTSFTSSDFVAPEMPGQEWLPGVPLRSLVFIRIIVVMLWEVFSITS